MRIHARDDIDMLYAEDDLLREDSYKGEGSHYKITYEGYIFDLLFDEKKEEIRQRNYEIVQRREERRKERDGISK